MDNKCTLFTTTKIPGFHETQNNMTLCPSSNCSVRTNRQAETSSQFAQIKPSDQRPDTPSRNQGTCIINPKRNLISNPYSFNMPSISCFFSQGQ